MESHAFKIPITMPSDCERCNEKLKESLLGIKGIEEAEIDPKNVTLNLVYDPNFVSLEHVEKRAEAIGLSLAEQFNHETLILTGLDCADCALKLERGISRLDGVLWVSVNFATSTLNVEFEAHKVKLSEIISIINGLGYGVEEIATLRMAAEKVPLLKNKNLSITLFSGLFLVGGFVLSQIGFAKIALVFYGLAIAIGGFSVAKRGLYSLKVLTLDMNFLMTLAVAGAIAIGEWLEGAMVVFLFSLGHTLEFYTMNRTRNALRSLMGLSPQGALVKRSGKELYLPAEKIEVGDIFVVKPGEKIAMDGVVVKGSSAVNQGPVSGESVPLEKKTGDSVYAGTINEQGSLEVKVTKLAADNTLSRIIELVEEAQTQKAPTQQFTEKFGKYYTPVVIVLAALVATIPPIFLGLPFKPWFYRALVLLVVSCPCALVISTPVALVSAIGNAARKGVLIKGGAYLEVAGSLAVIAFDKTGTLTKGFLEVTDVVPFNNYPPEKVLALAAAVEAHSEHPAAKAVVRDARRRGIFFESGHDFEAVPGNGARASIEGETHYVGNWRFLQERSASNLNKIIPQFREEGKIILFVGTENDLLGIVAVSDELRTQSHKVIRELRQIGLKQVVMLTGDNKMTAKLISEELGIDDFHAELLPQEKVSVIESLVKKHGKVAMVGDGVNDAPALARASVGVAMGAIGTDVALETADMALMADDITKLPYVISLSRRALRVVKQNIAFSLMIVGLLLISTFAGWLNLALGVIGHEGSALLVIANGMRLLKNKA